MFDLKVGDKIMYTYAAFKDMKAEVTSICLAKNAAGDTIPWMDIKYKNPKFNEIGFPHAPEFATVRLACTKSNFAMMKVRKI